MLTIQQVKVAFHSASSIGSFGVEKYETRFLNKLLLPLEDEHVGTAHLKEISKSFNSVTITFKPCFEHHKADDCRHGNHNLRDSHQNVVFRTGNVGSHVQFPKSGNFSERDTGVVTFSWWGLWSDVPPSSHPPWRKVKNLLLALFIFKSLGFMTQIIR
jgi:hypothetical protein